MTVVCWICSQPTVSKIVRLRSQKEANLQICLECKFEFFDHDNIFLLEQNQLDKTRLESAGLDIPTQEKDFINGYNQSKTYMNDYITKEDIGENILEIGCSWGYFLKHLKEFGCIPYGVEINSIRSNFVQFELKISCYENLDKLINLGVKFKKVFSFYCLEYIKDPIDYFQKILSLLQKGGEIIFITPNVQDALKDVWQNKAYRDFFYDECAIAYYSKQSIEILVAKLKANNSLIKSSISVKQGYSIFNHLYWHFNQRPVKGNSLVGGDDILNNLSDDIDKSSEVGQKFIEFLTAIDRQYKTLIEKYDYGNQIIIKINNK
jgi:hypothetical protein